MENITPEEFEERESRMNARLNEQRVNNDYDYLDNGDIERCDDCGAPINSHGHCPNCDY